MAGTGTTHDMFVNLIGKAISTGCRSEVTRQGGIFLAGRVSAFAYSAAMLADMNYNADFEAVRHAIMTEASKLRYSLSVEDRRDAARVGELATKIANKVLAA